MELVIIIAVVAGIYFFSRASGSIPVQAAPTSSSSSPDALQQQISILQNEVATLTKPPDPLAPKTAAPVVNVLPTIPPPMAPSAAIDEAWRAETNRNPNTNPGTAWYTRVSAEIPAMHTLAWNPATGQMEWSGSYQPNNDLQLVGTGSNLALSATSQITQAIGGGASAVASAIPFIGAAVSGIVGLFGAISAHHRAAVQRDSNAYNDGLSSAENYLKIIHDAVESGQSTPDEGINALDSLYSSFLTFTAPARNNNPYCNSVCEAKVQLNALVIYWKAYYNAIIIAGQGMGNTAAPPPPAPALPPAAPVVKAAPAVLTPQQQVTSVIRRFF